MDRNRKTHAVTYVDGYGKEHDAIVTAVNVMNPGFLSLAFVDANAEERDNVVHKYDVPHRAIAPREQNPNLPQYDVNCWKDVEEPHAKLPEDHAAFDHPFVLPEKTETGDVIPKPRPKFAAAVHEHMKTSLTMAAGTPVEPESHAAQQAQQGFSAAAATHEVQPGMIQTADENEQLAAELERELNAPPIPITSGVPSAEDLDAAAAEQAAAEATSGGADLGRGVGTVPPDGTLVFETKQYADGSSATGVAPLPDLSPDEQAAQAQEDPTKPFND